MSLQELPKTVMSAAVSLLRLPLELIERVFPGRDGADRAGVREPLKPDPGATEPKPTSQTKEKVKPDPAAPKPAARSKSRKPASKKDGGAKKAPAAKKAGAKKPGTAKEPAAAKKPPAGRKPDASSETRAPAAESPGVVDEATDGLEAATDRAVTAREELEQAADRG